MAASRRPRRMARRPLWLLAAAVLACVVAARPTLAVDVGDADALAAAIETANAGAGEPTDVIITQDIEVAGNSLPAISGLITITGASKDPRPVLTLRGSGKLFDVLDTAELTVKDLQFRDAVLLTAADPLIFSFGQLSFTNVGFDNIVSLAPPDDQAQGRSSTWPAALVRLRGGRDAAGRTMSFTDCTFTNNNVTYGGLVGAYCNYPTVCNSSFTRCTFDDNYAFKAIVAGTGDSKLMYDTKFRNNVVSRVAPAPAAVVIVDYDSEFDGCEFNNNSPIALWTDPYFRECRVSNTIFANNHGATIGAALANGQQVSPGEATFNPNNDTYTLQNALRISNCDFVNNSASQCGGALWTSGATTIASSRFQGNKALDSGYGAAICFSFVSLNPNEAVLEVADTDFVGNTGGAIAVFGGSQSPDKKYWLAVENCSFVGNDAGRGLSGSQSGAFYAAEMVRTLITNSRFENNTSEFAGPGAILNGQSEITLRRVVLVGNRGVSGGALQNNGTMNITRCEFRRNIASSLGGAILNANDMSIVGTSFADNVVYGSGGALAVTGTSIESFQGLIVPSYGQEARQRVEDSTFRRNQASIAGGAMYVAVARATVVGSTFDGNVAPVGGALYIGGNETQFRCPSRRPQILDSTFVRNRASTPPSVVPQADGVGGAIHLAGQHCGLYRGFAVRDTTFVNNTANKGGALYLSCGVADADNPPSASLPACAVVSGCRMENNRAAKGAGGAIMLNIALSNVTCSDGSSAVAARPPGCADWQQDASTVPDGYGPAIASEPAKLIALTDSYSDQASASTLEDFRFTVQDLLDQVIVGRPGTDQALHATVANSPAPAPAPAPAFAPRPGAAAPSPAPGPSPMAAIPDTSPARSFQAETSTAVLLGQPIALTADGVATFTDLSVEKGGAGNVSLQVAAPDMPTLQPFYATVGIRNCLTGEVKNGSRCKVCFAPEFSYSTDRPSCDTCPANMDCQGQYMVAPNDEYWISANNSVEAHLCPNPAACSYDGRKGLLMNLTGTKWDINLQCAEGYTGNLCGVCAEGYARFGSYTGFTCKKCMSTGASWAVYLMTRALNVATILFIVWLSARAKDQHFWLVIARMAMSAMQFAGVIFNMNIPWPTALVYIFGIVSTLFLGSDSLVPLECFIGGSGDLSATQMRIIWTICIPVLYFGVVCGIIFLASLATSARKRSSGLPHNDDFKREFRRLCGIAFVAVGWFFLPWVSMNALSLFSCIQIDSPTPENPYYLNSAAPGKYWSQDLNVKCLEGTALTVALAAGIPAIFLYEIVYILLLTYLVFGESRHITKAPGSMSWLSAGVAHEFMYWEIITMLEKLAVVIIVVFLVVGGGPAQGTVTMILLLIFFCFHFLLQPMSGRGIGVARMGFLWRTRYSFVLYMGYLALGLGLANVADYGTAQQVSALVITLALLILVSALSYRLGHIWEADLKPAKPAVHTYNATGDFAGIDLDADNEGGVLDSGRKHGNESVLDLASAQQDYEDLGGEFAPVENGMVPAGQMNGGGSAHEAPEATSLLTSSPGTSAELDDPEPQLLAQVAPGGRSAGRAEPASITSSQGSLLGYASKTEGVDRLGS